MECWPRGASQGSGPPGTLLKYGAYQRKSKWHFHRAHAAFQHGLIRACSGLRCAPCQAGPILLRASGQSLVAGEGPWAPPENRPALSPCACCVPTWPDLGMFGHVRGSATHPAMPAYSSVGLQWSQWWLEKGPGRRQRIGPPFHRAHAASQHGLIWACLGMFGAALRTLPSRAYSSEGLQGSLCGRRRALGAARE